MNLKKDKSQAQKTVKEIVEKSKELYDISALGVDEAKIKANDWYQLVISVVKDLFYNSQEIIDQMNEVLIKEGRPTQGYAIKSAFSIQTIDLEHEKEILVNKVKKIATILTDAVSDDS